MALSRSVLEFLDWLDQNGEAFDSEFLINIVGGPDGSFLKESHEEDPEAHAEYAKFRKLLRAASSQVTRSKVQLTEIDPALERLLAAVSKLAIDDPLDDYVVRVVLREVPPAVARLKKMSTMRLLKQPGEAVITYFRQAVSAYVCGLYAPVAVLSRSALEFALRETLTERGLMPVQSNGHGEGSIKDLIDWAWKAKILESNFVQDAHAVRKTGNKVHEKPISERAAFESVSLTVQLLSQIYGSRKVNAKNQ
jgi:hypothetical protein